MLELNKLYNMDCMQGMKEFPDGFFDLAIVDPPYGIGIDGQKKRVCGNPKHNRKEHIRKSWDKAIPTPEYFRELERVSKAQVIWGGNYFVPYLEQGHKGWLVWDKGQHGLTMSDCELAYTSFDTPTRVFVCNRVELLNDGTIHPTIQNLPEDSMQTSVQSYLASQSASSCSPFVKEEKRACLYSVRPFGSVIPIQA